MSGKIFEGNDRNHLLTEANPLVRLNEEYAGHETDYNIFYWFCHDIDTASFIDTQITYQL